MGRHCLCDIIRPIIILTQGFGLVPLSSHHVRKAGSLGLGQNVCCELHFTWNSVTAVVNTLLIGFFVSILPLARGVIQSRMSAVFSGTDLYAFTLQAFAMVLETTVFLTFGRLRKDKFAKGWKCLNEVFNAICDTAEDLRRIKIGCYLVSALILIEAICCLVSMYFLSLHLIGIYQNCYSLLIGNTIVIMTLIIPYILSTLFLFICLIIRSQFLKITDMLRTIIAGGSSSKLFRKIDSMRVLHEQLCSTVSHFEDFFGVQVLLTLCTCCFTITVGAYATILQQEGISSPRGKELTGAWGMQIYFASIFLCMILISGQLVTNAAGSAATVLNSVTLSDLDEKSQQHIAAFLYKLSAFPTQMKAVNITSISTTFLASAATNVITYLLVLMQFKLSFENWQESELGNTNSTVTVTPQLRTEG